MRQENGFWFPESDTQCSVACFREYTDSDRAASHVRGKRLCVQAGGNCGVWAAHLANTFDEVWTFEADLENYLCLLKNLKPRVLPFWAALGHKSATVNLIREKNNAGAHRIDLAGGPISMLSIDELDLPACDLIVLDIEGAEPLAIDGAKNTIEKFKPVLMIEDRDISRHYGYRQGWPETNIPGYRVAERTRRDVILIPA